MSGPLSRRQFLGTTAAGSVLLAGQRGARRAMAAADPAWPKLPPVKIHKVYVGRTGGIYLSRPTVEIEKFNGFFVPSDKLPQDRLGEENGPLITRTTKTDRMGYFVCSLDSPGWWILSVSAPGGKKVHERKTYPVEMRGCLLVYVEPPPTPLSPPEK